MTDTGAGWKPALHGMRVDLDFYGFCFRLYCGVCGGRVVARVWGGGVGVAANSEVAIHAGGGFAGITIIPKGEERRRLGALPVGVLIMETETLEILERWGVETLEGLAALPVLQLSERLGPEGGRHCSMASGVRQRSVMLAPAC